VEDAGGEGRENAASSPLVKIIRSSLGFFALSIIVLTIHITAEKRDCMVFVKGLVGKRYAVNVSRIRGGDDDM